MPNKPATCGEGLAANAVLPEKIAALISAMAELLQNHTRALDLDDANARMERDAYEHLVTEQSAVASSLRALAAAMRGYRDLPAAPHNYSVLADQKSVDVFRTFVGAEEAMLAELQENVHSHREMLSAMEPQPGA